MRTVFFFLFNLLLEIKQFLHQIGYTDPSTAPFLRSTWIMNKTALRHTELDSVSLHLKYRIERIETCSSVCSAGHAEALMILDL